MALTATFSSKYQIYLILTEDWKLYILKTKSLDLLSKVHFDSKYNIGLHFIDNFDDLLCIGDDCKF